MASTADTPLRRLRLADFQIDRAVFQSPASSVFKGRDKQTGLPVALKLRSTPELDSDWLHEAELLNKLRHPSLVRCLGVAAGAGGTYVVLEWAQGGTLADMLRGLQQRQLSSAWREAAALHVLAQLSGAVAYLHDQGIVHRDLKPQNTLIMTDWQASTDLQPWDIDVKVADLGISREVGGGASHRVTQDLHTFHGTPLYISPEMADGRQYSKPVDVWALGVLLFECLAGHTPFARPSLRGTLAAIAKAQLPRMPPGASPGTAALITDMLSSKPSRRPSAQEVRKRCLALCAGHASAPSSARGAKPACEATSIPVPGTTHAGGHIHSRQHAAGACAEAGGQHQRSGATGSPSPPATRRHPKAEQRQVAAGSPSRAHLHSEHPAPTRVRVRVSRRRRQQQGLPEQQGASAQPRAPTPPQLPADTAPRSVSPIVRVRHRVAGPPPAQPLWPPHAAASASSPTAAPPMAVGAKHMAPMAVGAKHMAQHPIGDMRRKSVAPSMVQPSPELLRAAAFPDTAAAAAVPSGHPARRNLAPSGHPARHPVAETAAAPISTKQRVSLRRAAGRLVRVLSAAAAECVAVHGLPPGSAVLAQAAVDAHAARELVELHPALANAESSLRQLLVEAGVHVLSGSAGHAATSADIRIPAVPLAAIHTACRELSSLLVPASTSLVDYVRVSPSAPGPSAPGPLAAAAAAAGGAWPPFHEAEGKAAAAAERWPHRARAAHNRVFKAAQLHMFGAE